MIGPSSAGPVAGASFIKNETALSYSREESIVNNALLAALEPAAVIRAGAHNQRELFPPRWGYERREPGIHEVLNTGRFAGPDKRMDYSGSLGSYSGTDRPSIGML